MKSNIGGPCFFYSRIKLNVHYQPTSVIKDEIEKDVEKVDNCLKSIATNICEHYYSNQFKIVGIKILSIDIRKVYIKLIKNNKLKML